MGRPRRVDAKGYAYHVLNRAVGRRMIFQTEGDFAAFERVLAEAVERSGGDVQLLAYCVMGNHWHLVVRTTADRALSPFMKWLTLTHTQRYQVAHASVGDGPVYKGRYKSFVIESGEHLLTVCRYVERNAARAALVQRAEDWQWSSLWRWRNPGEAAKAPAQPTSVQTPVPTPGPVPGGGSEPPTPLVLSPWPTGGMGALAADGSGRPRYWLRQVNTPHNDAELAALRRSLTKSTPFGGGSWSKKMIDSYDLDSTTRDRGRPRGGDA